MKTHQIYLKTIFCCMACDGDIAQEEIELVLKLSAQHPEFKGLDVKQAINGYVEEINASGAQFLKTYLKELAGLVLSDEEQLRLVNFALQTIYADNRIEYAEVKFFKKIRACLSLSDEQILAQHPDAEDFLLPDIHVAEDPEWDNTIFEKIDFALIAQN